MERQKGVVGVVWAFQKRADPHILDVLFRRLEHAVQFGNQALVLRFLDESHHFRRVFQRRFAFLVSGDLVFNVRNLPSDLGGLFEVLPHFRLFLLCFELGKPLALIVEIERIPRLVQHRAQALYFQSVIVCFEHKFPCIVLIVACFVCSASLPLICCRRPFRPPAARLRPLPHRLILRPERPERPGRL